MLDVVVTDGEGALTVTSRHAGDTVTSPEITADIVGVGSETVAVTTSQDTVTCATAVIVGVGKEIVSSSGAGFMVPPVSICGVGIDVVSTSVLGDTFAPIATAGVGSEAVMSSTPAFTVTFATVAGSIATVEATHFTLASSVHEVGS